MSECPACRGRNVIDAVDPRSRECFECLDCGARIRKQEADGQSLSNAKPNQIRLWAVLPPMFLGILTFAAGVWFFLPDSSPDVASNVSSQPALDTPASSAATPSDSTSPKATTDEPPRTTSKFKKSKPPSTPEKLSPIVDVNPRLTWDNYVQIHDGMTEDQVKSLLGDPTAADSRIDRNGNQPRQIKVLQWAQNKPFDMVEVEFIDGRSVRMNSTLAPTPAPPPLPDATPAKPPTTSDSSEAAPATPPKIAGARPTSALLTRGNFEQIVNGMTEDQVVAILGRPNGSSSRTTTMEGHTFHRKSLMWVNYEPYIKITVTLHEGKVAGKNCIQIGPKKP